MQTMKTAHCNIHKENLRLRWLYKKQRKKKIKNLLLLSFNCQQMLSSPKEVTDNHHSHFDKYSGFVCMLRVPINGFILSQNGKRNLTAINKYTYTSLRSLHLALNSSEITHGYSFTPSFTKTCMHKKKVFCGVIRIFTVAQEGINAGERKSSSTNQVFSATITYCLHELFSHSGSELSDQT